MKNFNQIGALVQEEKRANQNESFNSDSMAKVIGKVALEQANVERQQEDLSEKWDKFGRRRVLNHIDYADVNKQHYITELANVMEYRRSRQGDVPFTGKLGDIEFTINPKNPYNISFGSEDRISSATINGEEMFVEYGLESNSFLGYESDGISASNLNLRKTIFVTNDGEISEEYFLSRKNNEEYPREETFWPRGKKYWSEDGKNDDEMAKIVSDFLSKHPEYEAGADKNTFIRSNIEPEEVISSEPLDGFQKEYQGLSFRWNDRSAQEYLFKYREGQDLNAVKTYGDIIPFAQGFGERCQKVYDIATAAYEKSKSLDSE